jgi:pyruvate kinase
MANDIEEPAVFLAERMKLLRSAVAMANELPNSALLCFTRRGITAAGLAAHRPACAPILAVTDSIDTLRHLKMVRSVEPYLLQPFGDPERTLERAVEMLRESGRLKTGDKIVIISDVMTNTNVRIDSIQLRTVE